MSTQIVNPVRSDLTIPEVETTTTTSTPTRTRSPRAWAVAGVAAGVAMFGSVGLVAQVGPVTDPATAGDAEGITARMVEVVPQLVGLHVVYSLILVGLAVFGFGLFRRLRDALPAGSTIPGVALFGTLATAVVMAIGTGLDTDFIFQLAEGEHLVPETVVLYDTWINTMPSVWMLLGFSALAVYAAARRGAVSRWLGRFSLGCGALMLLVGIVPLQYTAPVAGALWLIVAGLGLALGGRKARA